MQLTSSVRSAGLGELCVATQGDDVLTAQGLGSCVGIAAYEPVRKIAMLAHVMLPGPTPGGAGAEQPARFAAQAVDAIVETVERHGGLRQRLVIKIAGGAQVIKIAGMEDRLKIGARNITAVHEALATNNLRVVAADTGGNVGRTLCLYAATGETTVRVVGGVEQPL